MLAGGSPEPVKGIAARANIAKLYVSTTNVACFDLLTDRKIWEKSYERGSDRMAISPDGILYVPSFEGPHWNVVDAKRVT